MKKDSVLVVGAGPVGLCMALGLAKKGIPVTVIEKEANFATIPKASTIHPPTLEIMEEWGIIDKLLAEGLKSRYLQYWDRETSEKIAEFDLQVISDRTTYPYRLQLEQSTMQVILDNHFKTMPHVNILFEHELIDYQQTSDKVISIVKTPDGIVQLENSFLIGSDGASSTVRKKMGVEYAGFTYPKMFLILGIVGQDFKEYFPGLGDVSYFFDPKEWVALIHNHLMWKFTVPLDSSFSNDQDVEQEVWQEKLRKFTNTEEEFNIVHSSIYRVHQRVASKVVDNRVILIGDAAHVNNPLGGMGMNSGIHDAYFLVNDLEKIINNSDIGMGSVLENFEKNRLFAIQEVQKRSIQNEKVASKADGGNNQKENIKRLASDKELSKKYLLETSMIEEFDLLILRNKIKI